MNLQLVGCQIGIDVSMDEWINGFPVTKTYRLSMVSVQTPKSI